MEDGCIELKSPPAPQGGAFLIHFIAIDVTDKYYQKNSPQKGSFYMPFNAIDVTDKYYQKTPPKGELLYAL